MRAVFADTFYWIAVTSTDDLTHQQALGASRFFLAGNIITTEEVLVEYLAYFPRARRNVRERAGFVVASLIRNIGTEVIQQSHQSFIDGLTLYRDRPDKGYSLTDCISMQTMKRRGLTDVLTNDRHFEQEGFRALFRS